MAWQQKARELYKRYGASAKFAAKLVLGAVVPGSPAVVTLIEHALDCAHEATRDNLDATPADLARLESALDVLLGDLHPLMNRLRRLEAVPDIARELLDTALATDDVCRGSARLLEQCVGQFDRLADQQAQLLAGQEEMQALLRRTAGTCAYVDDLRAAGCSPQRFGQLLQLFEKALTAFAARRFDDANQLLVQADKEQPQSGAVAVVLAATQTAQHQFIRAEGTLARAVRLRPADHELVELHRRVTVLSRRGDTPSQPSPTGPAPLQPGDMLDGWKLEQLLGRGGWGQVYRASRAGQTVALKVMHPELARDPAFVERFKREITALMRLDKHPSLVEIDTFGYDRAIWYFVMQFVEGISLEQHLARHGALSWATARPLFEGIADGLRLAHARGIFHRDLKPANLLVRPDGTGVVIDFGLAGTDGGDYTALFAAPEQLRRGHADARSDVYSLAATLYHALLYDDPARRDPHCYKPAHVPESIRPLLTRSLDNDPAERPADAAIFLVGLRHDPAAEKELIEHYRAVLDRTQGQPTDQDKTALKSLCRVHGIPVDRANVVLREVQTRWREAHPPKKGPRPGEIVQNALGMKFAWCPPGTFRMGSPESEAEREDVETQHTVTLTRGFYLGIHPVTQAEWRAVMGHTSSCVKSTMFGKGSLSKKNITMPREVIGHTPSYFRGDHLPVDNMTWDACQKYCEKFSQKEGKRYRLPTEAEWEYACRAGTTTPFHFGKTISTDEVNYDGNRSYCGGARGEYRGKTTPVGMFPPNALGLFDMHGNVWEWCEDWYQPHPAFDLTDPRGPEAGQHRVLRGGSWHSDGGYCRSASRFRRATGEGSSTYGFRIILCLD